MNHKGWFFRNKFSILLVILALAIIGMKFFPVSDGRFFVVGDDPLRHLAVINSFIEHNGIVYPQGAGGEVTAYIYYAPLFHLAIAQLSTLTQIPPIEIQNIVPLFCMVAFFILSIKILEFFFSEKGVPLLVATIALVFIPLPTPNPHYVIYYFLLPLAFYLMMRIFNDENLYGAKNIINFALLFFTVVAIGLTHAQSIAFYFVSLSLALVMVFVFQRETRNLRAMLSIWFLSTLGYITAFYLYSLIPPTFWEALLHYFSLQLFNPIIANTLESAFVSIKYNKYLVLGVMLAIPSLIFGILYLLSSRIGRIRNAIADRCGDACKNMPSKANILIWIPFGVILMVLAYVLIWNILFTIFQFVAVYLFAPAIPYFARVSAISGIYWIISAQRAGLEVLVMPYSIGLVILSIIVVYSIVQLFNAKTLSKTPQIIVLLAFLMPVLTLLFIFPLVRIANFIDATILDRFYYYTYIPLVVFAAPFIFELTIQFSRASTQNLKRILYPAILALLIICTTMGLILSASYNSSPIQNAGYLWLFKNSPIKETAAQLNFDILGYYHISNFPTHYSLADMLTIDLIKTQTTYQPLVTVSLFGLNQKFSPAVYWDAHAQSPYDEKIYDNGQISFYKEGN